MKIFNVKIQVFLMSFFALCCLLSFIGCETPRFRECQENRDYSTPNYVLKFRYNGEEEAAHQKRFEDGDIHHLYDIRRDFRIQLNALGYAREMCGKIDIRTIGSPLFNVEPIDGSYLKEIKYPYNSDEAHCNIAAIGILIEAPEEDVSEGIVYVDFYHDDCDSTQPAKTMTVHLHYED